MGTERGSKLDWGWKGATVGLEWSWNEIGSGLEDIGTQNYLLGKLSNYAL